MPSFKRKRIPENPASGRSIRRRIAARSKSGALSVNRIPRTLKEFPAQMRVKLKYVSLTDVSIPSGSTGYRAAYSCNSVYDPDPVIGGISAYGFKEWSAMYGKYTVVNSTCTFRLMDKDTGSSTTGTVTGLYGIAISDSSAPVPQPTHENLICDRDSVHAGFDSYHADARLTKRFSTAKYFGVKDLLDTENLTGATGTTLGTNPTRQAFFYLWARQSPDAGATAQTMKGEVFITYDVIFSQPAELTNS